MIKYFEIFYKNKHPYFNTYVHGLTSLSNLLNNTHLSSYDYGLDENRFARKEDALNWFDEFYLMVEKDVKQYNEDHPKGPQKLNPLPTQIYVIEQYNLINE
jgi:hypothetical protein